MPAARQVQGWIVAMSVLASGTALAQRPPLDRVPGAAPAPAAPFVMPAAPTFSLGVSLGLASYFSHTLDDMATHREHPLVWFLRNPYNRQSFALLLCKVVATANGTAQALLDAAQRQGAPPPPLQLLPPILEWRSSSSTETVPSTACKGPFLIGSGLDEGVAEAHRYYQQFVTVRETELVRVRKLDARAGQALSAGVNIGVAEGFATRGRDVTAIVRQALQNALPDVVALGLDVRRLDEAIAFSHRPDAQQGALHDMVQSLRVSFEASL